MSGRRIVVLIGKELREVRANPSVLAPVALVVCLCTILPFLVVLGVPALTGQSLSADRSLQRVVAEAAKWQPGIARLPADARVEGFLFQQFLFFFLMAPIVGAVSLAAHSVVGEKQERSLEPLLTTPISTTELLVAKALASFLPAVTIEAAGLCAYLGLLRLFAPAGVSGALLTPRTALLALALGPLAALTALQATIAASSRVQDPRSAQQIAVLLVLPLMVLFVGPIAGAVVVSTPVLAAVAAGLGGVWILLVMLSVALFDRETILTRWR